MSEISKIKRQIPYPISFNNSVSVGHIIDISIEGRLTVDYPENRSGPIVARCIDGLLNYEDCKQSLPVPVLLIFEENDFALPIIIGKLAETVPVADNVFGEGQLTSNLSRYLSVDGEAVVLEASKEIVLRCGKSSILLRKNGKIVVKGTEIISRSSGNNKLKGATVNIN
jgi:hypothetical protein